jgi:putative membrane protein
MIAGANSLPQPVPGVSGRMSTCFRVTRPVAAVVAILILLLPLGAGDTLAASPPENAAKDAAAKGAVHPVDRSFLAQAADLSRTQLALAQLGTRRATGSDLRAFAQQLASDHRQITDSVADLQRRKGIAGEGAQPNDIRPQQQLAEQTGAEFDREFFRLASEVHGRVMALFERATGRSQDAEVREFAAASLPALREHDNRIIELKQTLP